MPSESLTTLAEDVAETPVSDVKPESKPPKPSPDFERSAGMQSRINEIRAIPDKDERLESLRIFRFETAFQEAAFVAETVRILENDPSISYEDFVKALNNSSSILHPGQAEKFARSLFATCAEVSKALEHLDNTYISCSGNKNSVDQMMYLLPAGVDRKFMKGIKPTGYVSYVKSRLAVVLHTNTAGYAYMYNGQNSESSAGFAFFDNSSYFDNERGDLGTASFPLIVIKNEQPQSVELHEIGHIVNGNFKKAMEEEHQENLWGVGKFPDSESLKVLHSYEKLSPEHMLILLGNYDEELDNALISDPLKLPLSYENLSAEDLLILLVSKDEELKNAMDTAKNYALSRCKNELLADYKEVNTNLRPQFEYLDTVLTSSLYDYLVNDLQIPKGSPLYDIIRYGSNSEKLPYIGYEGVLHQNVTIAEHVARGYNNLHDNSKYRLLRNVLMRIPIDKWSSYLIENKFVEETDSIFEMDNAMAEFETYIGFQNLNFIPTDDPTVKERYLGVKNVTLLNDAWEAYAHLSSRYRELMQNSTTSYMAESFRSVANSIHQLQDQINLELDPTCSASAYRDSIETCISHYPKSERKRLHSELLTDLGRGDPTFYGVITLFNKRHRYEQNLN